MLSFFKKNFALVSLLILLLPVGVSVLFPAPLPSSSYAAIDSSKESVSAYIFEHGALPDFYITKNEARKLGWVASKGNLHSVAPGKVIGGNHFTNQQKLVPVRKGRVWFEADVNYQGSYRGAERLIYSNDRLVYYTPDHYRSIERLRKR